MQVKLRSRRASEIIDTRGARERSSIIIPESIVSSVFPVEYIDMNLTLHDTQKGHTLQGGCHEPASVQDVTLLWSRGCFELRSLRTPLLPLH